MKVCQIFETANYRKSSGIDNIHFCPVCGSPFHFIDDNGTKRPKCTACGFIYYKNPASAVSILIEDNNRILLGKRGQGSFLPGKWCLPCGFIEFDEDFLTAAIREVKEETGLDVSIHSIINVCSNFLSKEIHSLVIVLLANITGGNLAASDDLESVGWFDLNGILPEMAFAADISIIQRYQVQKIEGLPINTDFLLSVK